MTYLNSDLNTANTLNLVFIDTNISNYQTLASGIENAEIVLLDANRDGIVQITEQLANYSQLDSIQVLSHGTKGSLQLGNTFLSQNSLDSYADDMQQWGNALSEDGDLLLYGCNIAASNDGLALIEEISQLTQADIAASNNITGNSNFGGDWDLEVSIGQIEAEIAIDQTAQESFLGQLNLLVNSSFEANAVDGDRWANFAPSQVAGWQSLNGERIEIWDSGHAGVASTDGNNHLELDYNGGSNLDAIYQDIQTQAGQTYTLTFDMRSRGGNFNSNDEEVVVEWNGVKTKVDGYRATAAGQWRTLSIDVTGTGGSDRLLFRESGTPGASDGTGPFLDNISLEANASEPNPNPNTDEYRYIRFVANSEVNGNPWTSVAELNVLDANGNIVSQANWNLVSVNSEETVASFSPATNAFDGNNNTFWHTEWAAPGNANDPAHDHEIVIDLGAFYELSGFSYLPRQNGPNGRVANYQFFAADNTSNWGSAIATGTFANTTALQTVQFENNNPNPPSEGGLVGYWQFNEVSASTQVADASGNGNNGTNVNIDPGITSYSGPINSAPIFDEFNPRSWIFDGENDYVRIDPSPELDFSNGQFTQSVWIRPTATDNNYHGILGYQNGATRNRAPGLWTVGQTRIHAGFGDGTNWNNFTTGDVLRLNEWNHVVSSFDGTSYKIHVDGQEVFSTDAFAGRNPIAVDRLDIGRVDNYFEGQIDEVRLYDRAINNSEIQDLYVEQPNKAEVGDWSSPIEFPNIPVAAAVLPNGKVVTWSSWDRFTFGGNSPEQSYTSVWDPETGEVGEVLVTNTQHDMFCPGIAMLPDGRLLVMGGGEFVRSTSIYDFETETWSDGPDMEYRRWYNSALTLGNGEVFTIGGERNNGNGARITTGVGEIWNESTGWRTLSGTPIAPIANTGDRGTEHPQIFLAPNGKVFAAGPSPTMYWYDVNGNGSITEAGTRGDSPYSQVGAAIMYDEGKILFTGGANLYSGDGEVYNEAYSIDINNENNVTVDKQDSMSYERNYQTGVVLPNGEVLVVGGERGNRAFRDNQAVYRPELWNPETGEWRLMDNHEIPRTYHSVALLLPNGRVMAGGGGLAGEGSPVNHPDVEIFTPPYLYNEDGTLADRPVIGAGADAVGYDESFSISMDTDMPITEFNLVRMSAVTHGINTDQRFLSIDFTSSGNGNYQLNSPENGNIAPPGQYMLFAMNDQGVPSEAKIIQISAAGGSNSDLVNFNQTPLSSYAGGQDQNPTVSVVNSGTQFNIQGNGWKKIDLPYTVTANTVLRFEFRSDVEGEVHGIGFDTDNSLSVDRLFKLSGTQTLGSGINAFDNYVTGSGWQTYEIPVGDFFTGNFNHLTFANDHDVTNPTGSSAFRNIQLFES